MRCRQDCTDLYLVVAFLVSWTGEASLVNQTIPFGLNLRTNTRANNNGQRAGNEKDRADFVMAN